MSMKEKLLPKKDLVAHSGGRHETMKAMNFNDFNVLFTEQWIAYIKPCVYLLGNKMGFLFFLYKLDTNASRSVRRSATSNSKDDAQSNLRESLRS